MIIGSGSLVELVEPFSGGTAAGPVAVPTVTTFEEMWNHPMRNMERIEKHLGEGRMKNLISNLSRAALVSLYSGLGGAEATKSLFSVHFGFSGFIVAEFGWISKYRRIWMVM